MLSGNETMFQAGAQGGPRLELELISAHARFAGSVSLGAYSRLSDLLNREGVEFIPLIDATISGRNGEAPVQRSFIAVARDHVQLAYEAD